MLCSCMHTMGQQAINGQQAVVASVHMILGLWGALTVPLGKFLPHQARQADASLEIQALHT